jgi:hypothetical protein
MMSAALVFFAGGRSSAGYNFGLGFRSGNGTNRGWVWCRLGRVSAVGAAILGAGEGTSGAGARVPGSEGRIPEAGVEAVLLGAE